MIDVVTVGAGGGSIAWLSPEGTLKVGPQSAGADPGPLCYGKGGTEVTITDAHVVLGRIPPHLLGGEIPLDVDAARAGRRGARLEARPLAGGLRHRRPGDLGLEPGQRAAPGHRQARPRRPRLHADHVRRLRLAAAVPADGRARHPDRAGPAQPRQRLGVRPADGRREERLRADPRRPGRRARPGHRRRDVRRADRPRRRRTGRRGVRARAAPVRAHRRPALLRPGLRGAGRRCRTAAPSTTPCSTRWPPASTPSTGRSTATTSPATPPSRSSGSTSASPASARSSGPRSDDERPEYGWHVHDTTSATPCGLLRRRARGTSTPLVQRIGARRRRGVAGPVIIEEFGSTVPIHPGFEVRVDEFLNLIVTEDEGWTDERLATGAHAVPLRPPHRRRRRERRPGARRDRPGLAGQRRDGGRDRDRADQPQPDDPRRARLPGRHPRPAAAQADRPLVLRARAPGRPRLPARGDARGRRLLPQRRLPLRGRDRPPARPVRDRAGVCRGRGRTPRRGVRAGLRPPRRHRWRRARLDAEPRDQRLRGGTDGPADPALGRGRPQPRGADDHDPQLPDARVAGRRPRRGVLGLPDGRAAARRAVRPLRRGDGRVLLRRDPGPHHRDLPPRDPRQDPGRVVGLGGLRRARRRRRADAAHPADHADPHRGRRPWF